MEHYAAAEQHLVEQYLLNEMSPELREEFEEHFFDCQQCAADLRATAGFLEAARTELKKPEFATSTQPSPATQVPSQQGRPLLWKPVFAGTALAACVSVVLYQNVVVYPRLRNEVALLETPEILPTVSLVSGNSRGGEVPSATLGSAQSLLLLVDIPAQDHFSSYTCLLYSPQRALVWTGKVLAQEAKDTVSIRVPMAKMPGGTYSLLVRGYQSQDGSSTGVDLANYSFSLNAGSADPGK
jgi:hypothetical protein